MTRGGVTIEMPETELHLQTSGGVTNVPVPRLLINAQRRGHQQGAMSTPEAPLDQPSRTKTKGTAMTDVDTKEEAREEASHPDVEA